MIKRKDVLKAAFEADALDIPEPEATAGALPSDAAVKAFNSSMPEQGARGRVPSGAVRAMGLSLGRMGEDGARVAQLERQIATSEFIQDIDPALIDPSFVEDRLARTSDIEFGRLVESINTSSQQVPILVRPHPEVRGRYQVAYGHRRVDACAQLDRPVRAIIRVLSDIELVTAQGKENAERRNLSFIERALFAAGLENKGFTRATIQAALAVHPAEMTRLLAVTRSLPAQVIAAIGPAPRAGRPRWMELAALHDLNDNRKRLTEILAHTNLLAMSSDARFNFVIDALRDATPAPEETLVIKYPTGRPVLRVNRTTAGIRLVIDERLQPGLGDYLLHLLPGMVADHAKP